MATKSPTSPQRPDADRDLSISSDCHAGLPPEQHRQDLDAKYHAAFDAPKLEPRGAEIGPPKSRFA